MYISIEPTDAEQVLHSASYEQRLQAVLFSLGVCTSQCRASARSLAGPSLRSGVCTFAKQVPPCSLAVPRSAGWRKEASIITKQFFAVLASKEQSVCCSMCLPIPYHMGKTRHQWLVYVLFRLANTHQPLVYGTRAWLSKRVVFAPSVTVHSPSTQCAHLTPHTVGRTPRLSLAIANIAQAYTRSLPRSGSA